MKNVQLMLTGGVSMEEYIVVDNILHEYGLTPIRKISDTYDYKHDAVIIGCPTNMRNLVLSRPVELGKHTVVRVSRLTGKWNDEYARTKDEMERGAHIAGKIFSGVGLDIPRFKYRLNPDMDYVIKKITNSDMVTVDFETTGLSVKDDRIVLMTLSDGHWTIALSGWQDIGFIMNTLVEMQIPLSAHNSKFEQSWFIDATGSTANFVNDTQVDFALLNETGMKGLDYAAGLVDCYGYEIPMKEFLVPLTGRKGDPIKFKAANTKDRRHHHEAPLDLLSSYGAKDSYVTAKLAPVLRSKINDEPGEMNEVSKWLVKGQTMLARMENEGICMDTGILLEFNKKYEHKCNEIASSMQKMASKNGIQEFNPNSSVQLIDLLYNRMKYPVFMTTNGHWVHPSLYKPNWYKGKGNPSACSDAIAILKYDRPDDEFLDNIGRFNSLSALRSGVVSRCMQDVAAGRNVVRSNFDLCKLVTGQLSSTNPPMMNVPKNDLRRVFTSRWGDEGCMLEIDYSQLHLRIIGALANCSGFIDAYSEGRDLHSQTAANVISDMSETEFLKLLASGDEKIHEDRSIAKRVNFSIIFEIGAKALAKRIIRTEEECRSIIKNWFVYYPEIKEQINRQHEFAEKHGYIISPFGRVRHLPFARHRERGIRLRALRQAGDFKVSNSGRYMTLYGMILCDDEIRARDMQSRIVCQVHDSILLDVVRTELDDVIDIVKRNCINWVEEYCGDWMCSIPIVMEGFYGPNWYSKDAEGTVWMDGNKTVKKEIAQ